MKFAQMGGGDEVDIENIDGEWLNICQATTNPI
jgi:hypothetical protein